jgi:hypothetical protein
MSVNNVKMLVLIRKLVMIYRAAKYYQNNKSKEIFFSPQKTVKFYSSLEIEVLFPIFF